MRPARVGPGLVLAAMAAGCATPGLPPAQSPDDAAASLQASMAAAEKDGYVVLRRVPPRMPERALRRGLNGCVAVSFDITDDGLADNYDIIASEPGDEFVEATLQALNGWRFQALREGVRGVQVLEFNLEHDAPPSTCQEAAAEREPNTPEVNP